MILLWVTDLIVDFLSGKQENAFLAQRTISIHAVYPDVVIGDDDEIEACLYRCESDLVMTTVTIRVY